jgi:hypothetical protein
VDEAEARGVALARVRELRELSWAELRDRYLDRDETVDVTGPSGMSYQVETQVLWDDAPERNLRVFVSVDDGSFWRAVNPLLESFIMAPDGRFVGE